MKQRGKFMIRNMKILFSPRSKKLYHSALNLKKLFCNFIPANLKRAFLFTKYRLSFFYYFFVYSIRSSFDYRSLICTIFSFKIMELCGRLFKAIFTTFLFLLNLHSSIKKYFFRIILHLKKYFFSHEFSLTCAIFLLIILQF